MSVTKRDITFQRTDDLPTKRIVLKAMIKLTVVSQINENMGVFKESNIKAAQAEIAKRLMYEVYGDLEAPIITLLSMARKVVSPGDLDRLEEIEKKIMPILKGEPK